MKKILLLIAVVFALGGDFEDGQAAYDRGTKGARSSRGLLRPCLASANLLARLTAAISSGDIYDLRRVRL